jgi:hypothetical protein
MKKLLKYAGLGLLSLLILAFLLPILFKGKIVTLVKSEINKSINAKVDFKDVSLSLFRHFPKLSIGLEAISVEGVNEFKGDTLLSAQRFDASVNLMSLFGGKEMKIYGLYLQSPRIHALVNKEGKANWEIAKNDTAAATGEASDVGLKLEQYAIENGYIYYRDETADMRGEITGVDHEGSGDLTADVFHLATKTKAASASFTYAGIPYLVNASTGIDADFEIDNGKSRYGFKNAAIAVNDLKLVADGFMQLDNDSTYSMDISFNAPSNEFKNILSLVPAIYKTDFEKLKTSGTAAFKGFVKGTYSPTQLPAYKVDLDIKNGFFQYPDLPQPVQNVNITMQLANPDGVIDHTVVDISKGHLEMGKEPFDFRLLFKNPETAKYIDAVIKGKLNLADLSKFVKLEGGTRLSGLLMADAFAKGSLSGMGGSGGQGFSAGGFFDIRDLYYASRSFPHPLQHGNFKIAVENSGGVADATRIDVSSGHIEVGTDPFDFTLKLSRLVTDVAFSGTAKGKFTLDNVKQFVALEPGTSVKGLLEGDMRFSGSKADVDRKAYENIHTSGTVKLTNVSYTSRDYPDGVQVNTATLQFQPNNIALENFEGAFQKTHLTASGVLHNMIAYALRNEEMTGTVNVTADKINLNDWMGTTTTATSTTTTTEPFPVPANLNVLVNAKAGSVQYDKVTYNNVRGALLIKEETVRLQHVQTEALDGSVTVNGSYSTKQNKAKPEVSLSYLIKDVDVQKAFLAYNTVQKLMPIGKFLSGKMSSQFSMIGTLNADMFPDLNSLTGNGNFFLLQGVLSKFQPLEKISSALNVAELKDVSLRDIKSHFEFANGKVLVKPFHLKVKDIEMQIGGMHGFDQALDYLIGMKVPRKYLGSSGNALVNNLAATANSKGIPVTLSDVVDLNLKMGGTISNPVLKTDLKQTAGDVTSQMKQQATAFVQQKTEETKQTIKDSVAVVKKQVMEDVKGELAKQLLGNKDSADKTASLQETKTKASETIKNTLGGLFKKKKPAVTDTAAKSN